MLLLSSIVYRRPFSKLDLHNAVPAKIKKVTYLKMEIIDSKIKKKNNSDRIIYGTTKITL